MNPITHATSDPEIFLIWLRDKSTTTQVSYRSTASQFVDFIGKPLADVTLEDLQLWVRRLQLTFSPSTVANKVLTIKSLFSFCVKVGYLQVNIGSFIKCPKVKDKLAERVLSWTLDKEKTGLRNIYANYVGGDIDSVSARKKLRNG